jgi:hypothetical protein
LDGAGGGVVLPPGGFVSGGGVRGVSRSAQPDTPAPTNIKAMAKKSDAMDFMRNASRM